MKRCTYRWRIVGGVHKTYGCRLPLGIRPRIQLQSGESKKERERERTMMTPRANWMTRIAAPVRELGPYAAIELILPGGSLIALSLWAIRHREWFASRLRALLSSFSGLV
jgi:hypothetical protein